MSRPLLDPSLFDDPRVGVVRRCFRATGYKKIPGKKGRKKEKWTDFYVNASCMKVAERVGRSWLGLLGYTMHHCIEITWDEYAMTLPSDMVTRISAPKTLAASRPCEAQAQP